MEICVLPDGDGVGVLTDVTRGVIGLGSYLDRGSFAGSNPSAGIGGGSFGAKQRVVDIELHLVNS